MPPLRRALVAALLVVPAMLAPADAKDCGSPRADAWVTTSPGPFSAGDPRLTALAVLPRNPDTMVVSNGTGLNVTDDAGCTWKPVTLPAAGLLAPLGSTREIVDVVAAHARTGTEAIWVLGTESGNVTRPTVLKSTDGGATFTIAENGLPPAGEPSVIAAGPDDQTAYVVVELPSPVGRRLYATTDGGASWIATAPTDTFGYDHVAVDTVNAEQLFAWKTEGIAVSYDSGATFVPLDLGKADGLIRDVAVGQAPRGSRLAVLLENGRLLRSDDAGKSWTTRKVDPVAEQVSAAPEIDAAAVAGPGVVTLLPSVFRAIDASPFDDVQPLDLTLGLLPGNQVRMVGRVDDAVLTYAGARLDPRVARGFDLRAARITIPVDPALVPVRTEVTLAPGESKVVDYELDVPATPSPIEVFFLIDTTGSMGGVIEGVRQGLVKIVNDLAAAGIAARFGVGEVKDYPFDSYGAPSDLPYRLFRKVGPVDDELADALASLQASGGGDGPEAMLTGYYQLATGAGEQVRGMQTVPRGDDAGFAGDDMRIVLSATDTTYHQEDGYPGPSLEKAHAALRKERINVIGLAASTLAIPPLRTTAEDTKTFAPENGVDCNMDGKVDLAEGEPLVCTIAGGVSVNIGTDPGSPIVDTGGSAGIAPAIVSLLRGIHDPAVLTVASSTPDVAKVLGKASVPVDLKMPHAVPYRVRLSCPAARYGSTVDARLAGSAGDRELAAAAVSVRCLAPERPEPEAFLDKVPRPLAAAAAAPPAPPVQPVNNLQPNMNPQPNPNAQLQAGMAQQEQEQIHLALVTGDLGPQEDGELAMVRRDLPAPVLPAVAAMTAAAAAWAVAFRTGPQAAYLRRRRLR